MVAGVRRAGAGAALVGVLMLVACQPVPVRRPAPATDDLAPGSPSPLVYLRLKLDERRVYVMPADVLHGTDGSIESFPVAIGQPGYDTPTGRFQVIEKVVDPEFVLYDDWEHPTRLVKRFPPGPTNPLGLRWIGFAAAHGWTIGFHGTPHPELLGRAVSHGCVRMRNQDVVRLFDRVAIGTTVVVEQ